jgi:CspA family cold shock protein
MLKGTEDRYLNVTGKVKWFNQFKGYGFVDIDDLLEDVFLHFSVISQAGIERLNNDDVITCNIAKSDKGYQVTEILEVIHLNKHEIGGKKPEKVIATMKWFNPAKGFGFAQLKTGEDVFVHSNLLKKNKMQNIEHGQPVTLIVHYTNFGYEALDLIIDNNSHKE